MTLSPHREGPCWCGGEHPGPRPWRRWARAYLWRLDRLDFRDCLLITVLSGFALGNSMTMWLDGPRRIGDAIALAPLLLAGAVLAFVAPLGAIARWLYLQHRRPKERQA